MRPESGLLKIRQELGLFANLRPAKIFNSLINRSSLKPHLIESLDLLIVRELVSGIYFGTPRGIEQKDGKRFGYNTLYYHEDEIVRIAQRAFQIAQTRSKKVTSVDKANVLESTRLWREIVNEVSKDYPDVTCKHLYVDNAAMQLVSNPRQFDVILTTNMFGDILSDIAAELTGSIGLLPSASIGSEYALFEPVHGSAPDIAGCNQANPLAMILSVGLMFEYFNNFDAVKRIEQAVDKVVAQGYLTADLSQENPVSCSQMGELIVQAL